MDVELERMREQANNRANRKRRFKAAFKILMLVEVIGLVVSGCWYALT